MDSLLENLPFWLSYCQFQQASSAHDRWRLLSNTQGFGTKDLSRNMRTYLELCVEKFML